jgi:OmpA-OmpF porin, OOP family
MSFPGSCFLFFTIVIFPQAVSGQNLVPNGSFEDYTVCPGSYSEHADEFRVRHWRPLTTGSPDYFNACSEGEAAVPYNWAGVSDPYDGYGYAGIYTWMNLAKDYREYLHCKLIEPLVKDSVYQVEFRYKLSSYSKYATDRIGFLLSDSIKRLSYDRPLALKPTFSFVKDSALTAETGSWEIAITEYKAKGNEQFLTIGNFHDNEATGNYHIRFRPESQPMLVNSAYYYVDDVRVSPKFMIGHDDGDGIPPVFTGEDPQLNTLYVLKNIRFEFNSYSLMPVSYADLDKVISYLIANPEISVRLSGHTDAVGNDEYNRLLSINRAKSAAAYLVSKGVDPWRVSTFGYGENNPLFSSETEEAHEINRRVEIEFHRPDR